MCVHVCVCVCMCVSERERERERERGGGGGGDYLFSLLLFVCWFFFKVELLTIMQAWPNVLCQMKLCHGVKCLQP